MAKASHHFSIALKNSAIGRKFQSRWISKAQMMEKTRLHKNNHV